MSQSRKRGELLTYVSVSGWLHHPWAMPPCRRLLAKTLLLGCVLLVISASASPPGARLRHPLEVHAAAAYLAVLLSLPALLDKIKGADGTDIQLAGYAGPAYTMASTVKLRQPGGTDMRFDGVLWDGEPFKSPIYYGYRGYLWPGNGRTGVMVDFTHIKAKARLKSAVDQSGTRDGEPVASREPLSATFRRLEFTHGYNFLTLNLLRRAGRTQRNLLLYVGVGAGIALPHVEVLRQGQHRRQRTSEYQVAFPAVQVLVGVEWRVMRHFSLFVEYKLSCARIRGEIETGGSVGTDLCTHQLLGGPAWHLKEREAAAAQ
jgi:hypothetical protein